VDAVQVQGLMGHASLLTTGAYDRRPELARLAAVERLHFPYPSRHEPAG
jgi:site-specific recombinase XerD